MKMEKDKDIIEFEDLFKEERANRTEHQNHPRKKSDAIKVILAYLILLPILQVVFLSILFGLDFFNEEVSEKQALLEYVATHENSFALHEETTDLLTDYIIMLPTYEGYYVYINKDNRYLDLMVIIDEDQQMINASFFDSFFDGTMTEWEEDIPIDFVFGKTQTLTIDFIIDLDDFTEVRAFTRLTGLAFNILNFSIYVVLIIAAVLILKSDLIKDFNVFKKLKSEWLSLIGVGYLYVIIGNLISNALSNFFSFLFQVDTGEAINQVTIIQALNSSGMILMFLSAVVLGPIVEELVFRKAAFNVFKSDKTAIIVSSISFGLIHVVNEPSIAFAFINGITYVVMGFVFGFIYLRSKKNIWAPIFVHMLSNLIAVLGILFLF